MQIPWKLKSAAFKVLGNAPEGSIYLLQKYVTGRSRVRIKEISPYWRFHESNIVSQNAHRVIEFGAGKSLAQNIYLSHLGIEQTCVDLNPMLDLNLLNQAIEQIAALGVAIDGRPVTGVKDLEAWYRIRYVAPQDMRRTEFPEACFDMAISTNTLEHIPAGDISAIFRELRRIIAPGGSVSARIDYSDHYSHTDRTIGPSNFLFYDERQWRRHNFPAHYQNRLRHGHFMKLFADAGWKTLSAKPKIEHDLDLQRARPELLCHDGQDHYLAGEFVLANPPPKQTP